MDPGDLGGWLAAGRAVILVDDLPRARATCAAFRRAALREIPPAALLILASRAPPPVAWARAAAWWGVLRVVPLGGLADADARDLLAASGLRPPVLDAVIERAMGVPLALAWAAMRCRGDADHARLEHCFAGLVRELAPRLLGEASGPRALEAMAVFALARRTTEALLAARFGDEAPALMEEVADWTFCEAGAWGLRPHPFSRAVLLSDLAGRDPEHRREPKKTGSKDAPGWAPAGKVQRPATRTPV